MYTTVQTAMVFTNIYYNISDDDLTSLIKRTWIAQYNKSSTPRYAPVTGAYRGVLDLLYYASI